MNVKISGMTCVMCSQAIETGLGDIKGVNSAKVDLAGETASIVYDPKLANIDDFKETIEGIGYGFLGKDDEVDPEEEDRLYKMEQRKRLFRAVIGLGLGIPLMGLMMAGVMFPFDMGLGLFFLTTPFFIFVSYPIFFAAFRNLRHRNLNMDVMYSMGMGAAYISSVMGTFSILLTSEFMFYDTVLMLAGFLTLGRFLEARAKGKTNTAIKKLMGLRPNKASVIRDGKEMEVNIEAVAKGDTVIVKPGERIPVDGEVSEGRSFVDESMITGEPIPVRKEPGSNLIGGTINGKSLVKMKATGVGADTLLQQIIRSVKEAQGSRPEIQRVADKVVSYFIPAVLTVAILAFVAWFLIIGESLLFSFTRLVAILVIACPCALGLATPTAVTVGIGRGAELGILIKNGEALQISGSIDTVVMDKTGTITKGRPVVVDIIASGMDEDEVLRYSASVEKGSEHPLGKAVLERAHGMDLPDATSINSIEGKGIEGNVDGKDVIIGKKDLMTNIPAEMKTWIGKNEKRGRTVSLVSVDGEVVGGLAITDEPKETSRDAISWMKRRGLDVVMITGDNQETAKAIGREVGISKVIAGVLPSEKADRVKDLQNEGRKVAFIGDGINDAPALAQADVGISMGSGTDIAMESGDIVLVKNDLNDGVKGLILSRKVMTRIKQNIFWAFAYNTMLIPVAAGVLHPAGIDLRPEFAGLAMALSSVTVVSLSLLLKRYDPQGG